MARRAPGTPWRGRTRRTGRRFRPPARSVFRRNSRRLLRRGSSPSRLSTRARWGIDPAMTCVPFVRRREAWRRARRARSAARCAAPDLELDLRARAAAEGRAEEGRSARSCAARAGGRPARPRRTSARPRRGARAAVAPAAGRRCRVLGRGEPSRAGRRRARAGRSRRARRGVGDLAFDARLLADYGEPPRALAARAALRVAGAPAPARAARRRSPGGATRPTRAATRSRTRSSRSPSARGPAAEKQPALRAAHRGAARAPRTCCGRATGCSPPSRTRRTRASRRSTRASRSSRRSSRRRRPTSGRSPASWRRRRRRSRARRRSSKRAEVELRAAQQRESRARSGG